MTDLSVPLRRACRVRGVASLRTANAAVGVVVPRSRRALIMVCPNRSKIANKTAG